MSMVRLRAPTLPAGELVCCGAPASSACAGETSDAWLLQRASPALWEPRPTPDPYSQNVTAIVSSSARPRDEGEANMRMLLDTVRSIRKGPLQLDAVHVVLFFDGLGGKPGVTNTMMERYASKIARVLLALDRTVSVLIAEKWLHQANGMRCVLEHATPPTRLLFAIQDDTVLGGSGGPIERGTLFARLLTDPTVEYVKFTSHRDCTDPRTHRMRSGLEPCTVHPQTPLLHQTNRWLDRPHLATREHYEARLFAGLPRAAKVTPEQWLDQRARLKGANWPLWTYGRRGEMEHDLHWPVLVEGRLVSKEFLTRQVGVLNGSERYAHSYLIHAYRGPTQDVKIRQIERQEFRAHNPLAWTVEDGLSAEELGETKGNKGTPARAPSRTPKVPSRTPKGDAARRRPK